MMSTAWLHKNKCNIVSIFFTKYMSLSFEQSSVDVQLHGGPQHDSS